MNALSNSMDHSQGKEKNSAHIYCFLPDGSHSSTVYVTIKCFYGAQLHGSTDRLGSCISGRNNSW